MTKTIKILCLLAILAVFFLIYSSVSGETPEITQGEDLPVYLPYLSVTPEALALYSKTSSTFEAIALCESGNNPKAKNSHSTASGRFQFLTSSWNQYGTELWGDKLSQHDVFDYNDNTDLAWYVYQKNGTRDWLASKKCWE